MSKKKAIEICENLTQTISKMTDRKIIEHKNPVFEIPRAKKKDLIKIRKKLIEKYK
tara:strand:+ start:541 stop:708 length:168 start_codon:yes stop_codon:yes gene_type:complete